MSDRLAARLRTLWPLWLGHLAALVVAFVARWTGVELDSAIVYELLGLVASWAIWEAGSRLERSPLAWRQRIGRWLVAAGRDVGQPTYPGAQ